MNNDLELSITMTEEETERVKKLLLGNGGVRHYLIKLIDNTELDVVEYKGYENMVNIICKLIRYAYGTEMSLGEFKKLFKIAFNKEYDVKKSIESQIEVFKNENT